MLTLARIDTAYPIYRSSTSVFELGHTGEVCRLDSPYMSCPDEI